MRSADSIYESAQQQMHRRTDRMFAALMIIQWVLGIGAALWISPQTWVGAANQVHIHVWAAIFLGAAISGMPVLFAFVKPGAAITRHVIAVGQMSTSALLIHLTGGRIETHFHVFGSLAFLAFYRDWRVLATGTVVVAADHLVRGLYWPLSVFGVSTSESWRWLEHAGWVIFEDAFLLLFIRQSLSDLKDVAVRRAELEGHNAEIERQVAQRTTDLTAAHQQLLEVSRHAGMAEVATNVLHNVGNVLNSVNVSADVVESRVRQLRTGHLKKVAELLREHEHDLPAFLTTDPRGKELPAYLLKLAEALSSPQTAIMGELGTLKNNIEHIKKVVASQQTYGRVSSIIEKVSPEQIMEDAIQINASMLTRHQVQLVREFHPTPPIITDRHQVMQILVNLLSNAKQALATTEGEKRVWVRIAADGNDSVIFQIADNGVGIPRENLTRIFQHGFTTRKEGHGYGLHSGSLSAKSLGGSLQAESRGKDQGAIFTLELPVQHTSPLS